MLYIVAFLSKFEDIDMLLVCFLRQGLTVYPWLAWNSLCTSGWPLPPPMLIIYY